MSTAPEASRLRPIADNTKALALESALSHLRMALEMPGTFQTYLRPEEARALIEAAERATRQASETQP